MNVGIQLRPGMQMRVIENFSGHTSEWFTLYRTPLDGTLTASQVLENRSSRWNFPNDQYIEGDFPGLTLEFRDEPEGTVETKEVKFTRVTVELELPFPTPHVDATYAVGELLSKMSKQSGYTLLDWHNMHEVTREVASDEALNRLRKALTGN